MAWWSYHPPEWTVYSLWDADLDMVALEELTIEHPAVQESRAALVRPQ